ncbi:hypothetical protein F4820DRAFT_460318 [Hypoxylon rubiginosum]|uniref:Uncharacterized protein n=1 Tax=Hypoxylon rubiginosum TaxID=110542 RepID=A0ACB9YTH0_9PEZI|nr:hypothetical protein F4820DRAFT_460318 [Hypoxylon rubiginosum]
MKSSVALIQPLVALTIAGIVHPRQGIDTSLVDSAPSPTSASIPIGPTADTTSYDLSQATESATASPLPVKTEPTSHKVEARQTACQPNPTGAGPTVSPDTDSAFSANAAFSTIAIAAPTPDGYNQTFVNLHARSEAFGYLGFVIVDSYDTAGCADQCDTVFEGCQSFNIFFERDPVVAPARGCRDPPSTTNIKCVFWGGDLAAGTATNTNGQFLVDFHVVVAGSNGYTLIAAPEVPGYDGEPTGNNTIDAPPSDTDGGRGGRGGGTYIGSRIFTDTYFDPQLCAAACDAQNKYNLAHPPSRGQPQICRFFTTYLIYRNGEPVGQYCALYTQYYPPSFATNGGTRNGRDTFAVRNAFSYRNRRAPRV